MNDKIKLKEKVSYALINLGNIPVTLIASSFLMIFYTNVVGLDPGACATLFLVARIVDAVNDPFVGFFIDHLPRTRLGHFRSTLIVGAILCGLNYLLLWFGPLMFPAGKLVIAYVSYLLLGVLFPVMDISLNSLLPTMTEDAKERDGLGTIKGLALILGGLIVGMTAPVIIGDASSSAGYIWLIAIATALIIGLSVIGTLGVKERVIAKPGQKYGIKDLFFILRQKPVLSFFAVNLLFGVGNYICITANTYFYVYILGNLQLSSIASILSLAGTIPGIILSGKLVERFGKKNTYIIGLLCFGLLPLMRLISIDNIPLVFAGTFFLNLGMGFLMPHMYSILADNTDYVEIKTGYRAEAAVASLSSFVNKFSMGIGGAIPGYLLAAVGFDETLATQNSSVNMAIIACVIILPAVFAGASALIMETCYPLNKAGLEQQIKEIGILHQQD